MARAASGRLAPRLGPIVDPEQAVPFSRALLEHHGVVVREDDQERGT